MYVSYESSTLKNRVSLKFNGINVDAKNLFEHLVCDFMALHLGLVQTRTNWIDMRRRKMVPKKSILHPKRVKVFLGGSLVHSSIGIGVAV